MITLTLESVLTGETVNLGSLGEGNDEGAEAQPGVTGLGLPPVDTQWASGAGDGATYRGRRVPPRDIDVPIAFVADTRASLQAQLKAFARVQAGECLLWVSDPSEDEVVYRVAKVVRVGGGENATGIDTDGETYYATTVTFRAGDPFWISSKTVEAQVIGDEIDSKLITLKNSGTADAYPIWEVKGPTLGFKVQMLPNVWDPSPVALEYTAFIPSGTKIIVDTAKGTVVDQDGNNRYGGLATAPRFWKAPPGDRQVKVSMDRSSTSFLFAANTGIVNFFTNPRTQNDASGFSSAAGSVLWDSATKRLKTAQGYAELSPVDTDQYNNWPDNPKNITATITGLTVGKLYECSADWAVNNTASPAGIPTSPLSGHPGTRVVAAGETPSTLRLKTGTRLIEVTENMFEDQRLLISFVAADTSALITFQPRCMKVYDATDAVAYASAPTYYRGWWTRETYFGRFYLGEPSDYFDGTGPDNPFVHYSWDGTPDASTSRAISATPVDTSNTYCHVEFNPRDWMVM